MKRSGIAGLLHHLTVATTVLILASCARGGSGGPAADERRDRNIVGPVRRVTEKRYRQAHDGSGRLAFAGSAILGFDRAGRFLSEEHHDETGRKLSSVVVVRDRRGRPAGTETRSASGALEGTVSFSYDADGRLTEERYLAPDGSSSGGYRYEYDAAGRRSRRIMRAEYGDGSSRTNELSYRYDDSGLLVEEIFDEGAPGNTLLRIEHVYRDGRRIRSADYQRGSWLEFLTFYGYDRVGNRVRETSYQIPESEYGDSFASVTSEESLPRSLLASETILEYENFK